MTSLLDHLIQTLLVDSGFFYPVVHAKSHTLNGILNGVAIRKEEHIALFQVHRLHIMNSEPFPLASQEDPPTRIAAHPEHEATSDPV